MALRLDDGVFLAVVNEIVDAGWHLLVFVKKRHSVRVIQGLAHDSILQALEKITLGVNQTAISNGLACVGREVSSVDEGLVIVSDEAPIREQVRLIYL